MNHENIAEELSQALYLISEHVVDCETELEIFKTEAIQRAVADLYAHVFLFLTDTLNWYLKKRRKRLLDSFNENFLSEFDKEIENIKRKSEIIKRKAGQNIAAEQRVTRVIVEETHKDLRLGLKDIERKQAEIDYNTQQFNKQYQKERMERQEEKKRIAQLIDNVENLLTSVALTSNSQRT